MWLRVNKKKKILHSDLGLIWLKKKWSLITQNTPISYPHLFGTYFQFLITQFFLLFVGPMPVHPVISSISLPASPSLSSFHFLPLQSPLPCYSHYNCPLSLSFLMYTHINKNNPIPNLWPNHHKHTNTNEYKHKHIGTHRCSNWNPQIPKSKITNTDPLFEVKDRNITKKNVSNTDPHYGLEKRIIPVQAHSKQGKM